MEPSRTVSASRAGGILAGALLVLLTACGGSSHHSPARPSPSPSPTASPTSRRSIPTQPLTGLALGGGPASRRPALVVKIENSAEARPQSGLDKADVVYEAVAEGGITRFAAVFQSTDPGEVGPVRSVRPQDPDIVAPLRGITAFSGGVAPIVSAMAAVSQDFSNDAGTAPQAFRRSTDRYAPHNLYATAATLWGLAKPPYNHLPPHLFSYGRLQSGATPAAAIDVPLSPVSHVSWSWQAGAWRRSQDGAPFVVTGTGQVGPANLIIEYVKTVSAGYNDVAGNPVPTSVVTGSGRALLLRDGHVITGTWSKPGQHDVTAFTTLTGAPMALHPGRTWIELMPDTASATVTP